MKMSKNIKHIDWNKFSSIATILLTLLTAVYVILSRCAIIEMKKQTELTRAANVSMLRPYLIFKLESFKLNVQQKEPTRYPVNISGIVRINNEGSTHAEIIHYSIDISQFNMRELNVRDSVLAGSKNFLIPHELPANLSNFVPAKDSIEYISKWEDVLKKANSDGKIFLHTFIIYKDLFNKYHDTYCIFKIYIDWNIPKLMRSNPVYDFYEYSDKEINRIKKY